ncbi:hypothetical protein V6R21_23830 [Limibacter armeniacum]|uniref:hypothetical protein n=1 Tax=Limibacter armeniacum TaxID=466084 RepID=UPI002FE60F38
MKNLLVILLQITSLGISPLWSEPNNRELLRTEIIVERQFFNKHNASLHYQMDISYPLVRYPRPEVSHHVNLGLQSIMALAINDFRANLKRLSKEHDAGLSYLELDYKVVYQKNDILSIQFFKNTFYNGYKGVRKLVLTYNYDMKTQRLINLEDVFNEHLDANKQVIELLTEKTDVRKFNKEHVLSSFCLSDKGVTFVLDGFSQKGKETETKEVMLTWQELNGFLLDTPLLSRFSYGILINSN